MVKERCVLLQLVSHLINDKTAAGRESIVGFLQKSAFLVDLEDAKRDAGENVITMGKAKPPQFLRQASCVSMDDMNAWIARELLFQIARKSGIELEQEQV